MLTFRRVRSDDLWVLYAWRLEQQTAFWSLGSPPSIEQHAEWIRNAIVSEHVYIAERKNEPVAVMEVKDSEVSITVSPLSRKMGIGSECIRFLQRQYSRLTAAVVVGNTGGLRLFVRNGFKIVDAMLVKHRPCVLLEWSV